MKNSFKDIYKGKTVLVTGHTGFKGSWLSLWLHELGAKVIGYSLAPSTSPSNFHLTGLENKMVSLTGDIRDFAHLNSVVSTYKPDIIFHLAAQAIVLHSYTSPRETMEVNAMGTVNVLETAKVHPGMQAMVLVTTDKCYENQEWLWGYRENDPLGGKDPYSASKAMAELAIQSYRESFFVKKGPLIASARAGNVIGGGDFSDFRLVPDIMKALINNKTIEVRNPHTIRPWLHVLDPLCGYLQLGCKLLNKESSFAQAWNFGPMEHQGISVQHIVEKSIASWGKGSWIQNGPADIPKEMNQLRLNWDKAAHLLSWKPCYSWSEAIQKTVDWFKIYEQNSQDVYKLCANQIHEYMKIP